MAAVDGANVELKAEQYDPHPTSPLKGEECARNGIQ